MLLTASIVTDFWNHQLVEHDRQGVFLALVGFVGSFAFIRMSTRIARSPRFAWWPGSIVSEGGVHVHHLVPGIFTMLAAGTIGFAVFSLSPWFEIAALFFGIGAGLTIDEFALWLYLDDVYWANEGRGSVDATVIAAAGMLLVLFGARPFDITTDSVVDTIASLIGAGVFLAVVAICFLKRRVLHGTVGFVLFPLAIYGASRIGKPDSPWARRRYGEHNPKKQAKAEQRFRPGRRTERFKNRFRDIVGGTPTEQYEAKLDRRDVG
jgi:hypothetical protein